MSNSVWAVAGRLLAHHLASGVRLDFLLERAGAQLPSVEARRCRHLLYGAVRHLGLLDAALTRHLREKPRHLLRAALLLGAFELLEHPESAPAIVHHAVAQTRALASANEARVVNAVLRRVPTTLAGLLASGPPPATGAGSSDAAPVAPDVAWLARRFSHPAWLVGRWLARYGVEATRRLLEWDQQPAPVHARLVGTPVSGADATNDAVPAGHGVLPAFFQPTPWPGFFLLERADWDVVERALADGRIYLQDPATALAPRLLGVVAGETVLDVCAAPGGKSLQLAEAVGANTAGPPGKGPTAAPRGRVVAIDLPGPRLKRMRENLARHPALPVAVAALDARRLTPDALAALGLPVQFDAVLLDAPCSNTGVLRHRVDVKWRLRPEDLVELPRTQLALLRRAAALVRPGGRMVYSTCSLEAEENERVVEAFLADTGAGEEGAFTLERAEHSHPWESGCDGAAAFLLRRSG